MNLKLISPKVIKEIEIKKKMKEIDLRNFLNRIVKPQKTQSPRKLRREFSSMIPKLIAFSSKNKFIENHFQNTTKKLNKEIEECKLFTRTLMQNNGISEPKTWRQRDVSEESQLRSTMFSNFKTKMESSRNKPIQVTQTYDGPGITIETMEREKDRQFRKLKAEKLKVISRSLKRCFEPQNIDFTSLPFYKIVEMKQQRVQETNEIKRLFCNQTEREKMSKSLIKNKKPKTRNIKIRSKLLITQQPKEVTEDSCAHFFNSQSQIGEPITIQPKALINVRIPEKIVEKPRSAFKRPKTTKGKAENDSSKLNGRPSSHKTQRKEIETKVQFDSSANIHLQSTERCAKTVFEKEKKMKKSSKKSNSSSSSSSSSKD